MAARTPTPTCSLQLLLAAPTCTNRASDEPWPNWKKTTAARNISTLPYPTPSQEAAAPPPRPTIWFDENFFFVGASELFLRPSDRIASRERGGSNLTSCSMCC